MVEDMTVNVDPGVCSLCGSLTWQVLYQGPIRHGTFGVSVDATVFRCDGCGVGFLPSSVGLTPDYYAGREYRETVGEGTDAEAYFKLHDVEQLDRYPLMNRVPLRDRVVAEVGCAGGSFLDGVRGLASRTIAIEPAVAYHESLQRRGHATFPDLSAAGQAWKGKVDVAVCFSVIEHVADPVAFLRQIRDLMAPGGRLLLSTPNGRDILLEAGGDPYRAFFYRSVHSYYFDAASLQKAGSAAGFAGFEPTYIHRFNFGNFTGWLGQHKPTGNRSASVLGTRFDRIWKAELEESGRADYLYAWLSL
jgi:2-polyprenyl-3-methyl-5-hydroxy-6-metoxy-1,4-benzoquinol methylase